MMERQHSRKYVGSWLAAFWDDWNLLFLYPFHFEGFQLVLFLLQKGLLAFIQKEKSMMTGRFEGTIFSQLENYENGLCSFSNGKP